MAASSFYSLTQEKQPTFSPLAGLKVHSLSWLASLSAGGAGLRSRWARLLRERRVGAWGLKVFEVIHCFGWSAMFLAPRLGRHSLQLWGKECQVDFTNGGTPVYVLLWRRSCFLYPVAGFTSVRYCMWPGGWGTVFWAPMLALIKSLRQYSSTCL